MDVKVFGDGDLRENEKYYRSNLFKSASGIVNMKNLFENIDLAQEGLSSSVIAMTMMKNL